MAVAAAARRPGPRAARSLGLLRRWATLRSSAHMSHSRSMLTLTAAGLGAASFVAVTCRPAARGPTETTAPVSSHVAAAGGGVLPPAAFPVVAPQEPALPGRALLLVGGPFERGRAHGKALKRQIHTVFGRWRAQLHALFSGVDQEGSAAASASSEVVDAWVQHFANDFLAGTSYRLSIDKWAPGLLEEVDGMAQGAGIDAKQMLVFQLMDEYWFHGQHVAADARQAAAAAAAQPEHCTAFGVPGEAAGKCPAVVAQTMDLESFRDGHQTVLHISGDSSRGLPAALLFSHAGMVALCGVNSAGVACAVNNLSQLTHGTSGLPVAFVIRAVLQRNSLDEALAVLLEAQHASGQTYTIAGPDGRVAAAAAGGSRWRLAGRLAGRPRHLWLLGALLGAADACPDELRL